MSYLFPLCHRTQDISSLLSIEVLKCLKEPVSRSHCIWLLGHSLVESLREDFIIKKILIQTNQNWTSQTKASAFFHELPYSSEWGLSTSIHSSAPRGSKSTYWFLYTNLKNTFPNCSYTYIDHKTCKKII